MRIRDLMLAGHNVDLDDDVAGDGGITPLAGSKVTPKRAATDRTPSPTPATILTEQMLAEMRMLRETNTQLAALMRGQLVNDVLGIEIATFDAQGIITRDYRVAIGSITVANHTAADVIVASAPPGGAVPGTGRGLQRVRPAIQRCMNLGASHTVTLYGVAAGTVSIEVFTRPQPPSSGPA